MFKAFQNRQRAFASISYHYPKVVKLHNIISTLHYPEAKLIAMKRTILEHANEVLLSEFTRLLIIMDRINRRGIQCVQHTHNILLACANMQKLKEFAWRQILTLYVCSFGSNISFCKLDEYPIKGT